MNWRVKKGLARVLDTMRRARGAADSAPQRNTSHSISHTISTERPVTCHELEIVDRDRVLPDLLEELSDDMRRPHLIVTICYDDFEGYVSDE
mmetsp:Transcript_27996/g.45451  ORF Transcript_27996/g.45451 Transcript_27996/m.45451 type:complete len:92 (-) Transcript_27996:1202-1477(-)